MKELIPRCEVCFKKAGLFRCSKCNIVVYCGRECQLLDHPEHKKQCSLLVKFRADIDYQKQTVVRLSKGMLLPPNMFENHVGDFWGYQETRPFVRSISTYAQAAGRMVTVYGSKEAIKMALETIRLCSDDNLGIRNEIMFYYLILGNAESMQACYGGHLIDMAAVNF
jgi:hypothetical protein